MLYHRLISLFLSLSLALALAACAGIDPQERRANADVLAVAQQWKSIRLSTSRFVLAAYIPSLPVMNDTLVVYIEGDGLAWLTRSQASDDPTPRSPIGLQMALRHGKGAVAYLARPCQYVDGKDARGCEVAYWTKRRFAPEVVEATSLAIDELKQVFGANKLVLVGYSGGGAVAALVAARRQDVVQLVTVAGNLDHLAWTTLHRIPPLEGSLNPADAWEALQVIPQLHFVGGNDHNVRVQVANSFLARFPPQRRPAIQVIKGFDHTCCWADQWSEFSLQIPR
jgi:pimeloyl-ACP methyl ester carboxylesterase